MEVVPKTLPTPWFMVREVILFSDTAQDSVVVPPEVIVDGVAVKLVMLGLAAARAVLGKNGPKTKLAEDLTALPSPEAILESKGRFEAAEANFTSFWRREVGLEVGGGKI